MSAAMRRASASGAGGAGPVLKAMSGGRGAARGAPAGGGGAAGAAGVGERGRWRELDVEGDERGAGGDQGRAGGRVERVRAEVGLQLAALEPPGELLAAAASQFRARPPPGEVAVEEDGQAELVAEAVGDDQRL